MSKREDKQKGLYNKFNVTRTDGQHRGGCKHNGCEYFVLDLTHDKFAMAAIEAYAFACGGEYPVLAKELLEKVEKSRGPQ